MPTKKSARRAPSSPSPGRTATAGKSRSNKRAPAMHRDTSGRTAPAQVSSPPAWPASRKTRSSDAATPAHTNLATRPGVGAIAGGSAGALIGAVAGPIGAAVGAAIGTVAGSLTQSENRKGRKSKASPSPTPRTKRARKNSV
jgi:phage tail tape-measure protein